MRFGGVAALAVLALTVTGCSGVSTQPDQVALHYEAGPLSDTTFADCVEQGTRAWDGYGDKHYSYPAGQRTFSFADGDGQDSGPFTVPAGNVPLILSGVARFSLNTDCDTLREFHEQIGLKFKAYSDDGEDATSDGWRTMIATYVQAPLQRAMNDATQGADWTALYNDPTAKAAWEARVAELLPTYVEQVSGGDYFVDFQLTLQKPKLPDALTAALQAQEEAIAQNKAQEQRNVQVQSELESIRALVAVLGPDGYNTYQALKDGRITFYPLPQGSGLVLPPTTATP
jgi:hypothetical protein